MSQTKVVKQIFSDMLQGSMGGASESLAVDGVIWHPSVVARKVSKNR